LVAFNLYTRYKSQDDKTLSYMEDTLCHFHTFKGVSLLRRHGKKVKANGNSLGTELVKNQKVEEETNADTRTPSNKQREINPWRIISATR
jgi:hypothetical protein